MYQTSFHRIVRLVTRLLGAKAAAIALAEGDRLRVIAQEGCALDTIPRCGSLPGRTLAAGEPSVVADLAVLDPQPPVPLIDGVPLRFYAGVPIKGPDGGLVGTLCAGDVVPRTLSPDDLALLESLADLVADELRLDHERREQEQLLAALQAHEKRLADFAETASDWFWEMDAELRFSWLSESVRTRFGLDPAWHYGKSRLEIAATPADRHVAEQIQELMLRREPFRDFEYCRRSPAGDHWLRISGKPVFDRTGAFLGYRGTGRDVTELKEQERALREAEERYRTLLEFLPDAVFIKDEAQRILYANRAAAATFGLADAAALIGRRSIDFLVEEHRRVAEERSRLLLERGGFCPPVELHMHCADGGDRFVESVATRIEERGAPRILVVHRDITDRKAAERALREAEARYRALVELSPDPVILVEDGRFAFANRPAARLFGVGAPADLAGRSVYDFLPQEQHAVVQERHATPLGEGEPLPPIELEIVRPDGTRVEIEAKGSLVLHQGRRRLLGVLRDITERKAAERALKEAEERYRTLVEVAPVGILVYRDGCYRYANRAAAGILGAASPDELVGLDPFALILEPYHEVIRARSVRLLAGGPGEPPMEIEMRRLDGAVVSVATRGVPIREAGRPAIQIVIEDVTERKRLEAELRRLAYHDPLTGLANRALFFDRLQQALRQSEREGRRGALLLLDLDGFKQVNDAFGHDAGDALLRGVARRLLRVTRRSDTVARLAGDEFAVLLYPIRDAATVERVGERIRAAFAVPIRHRGRTLLARTSIGAVIFPDSGLTVDMLAKHADLALYRAKAHGRGGLAFVDRAIWLAFSERIRLGEELREAIAGDAIELAYEPRCALDSGCPVALEAVPLWSPSNSAPIAGPALLDLAIECGVAVNLALQNLVGALDACVRRDRVGLPALPLAIHLPTEYLLIPGCATQVLEELRARDIAPQRLAIEVAEKAFEERHLPTLVDTFAQLRQAGVTILLDRFGAGACSLRPLLDRLVDGVNFLAGAAFAGGGAGAAQALAASLAGVALPLGLQLTALGVASEEQRRSLAALGCGRGQGPLWSQPLSADALANWLHRAAAGTACPCALSDASILPRSEPTAPPRAP